MQKLKTSHLHPLSFNLPNVWELWLPQDKQNKIAFPQFMIDDGHGMWWICTISFVTGTEENWGLSWNWNIDSLQVGHLIFFFFFQQYNWFFFARYSLINNIHTAIYYGYIVRVSHGTMMQLIFDVLVGVKLAYSYVGFQSYVYNVYILSHLCIMYAWEVIFVGG